MGINVFHESIKLSKFSINVFTFSKYNNYESTKINTDKKCVFSKVNLTKPTAYHKTQFQF